MGPFRFVPFMQCRHSVFSLTHGIQGSLNMNGKKIIFNHGLGYMEGDRGVEFPNDYLWTQCNWIERGANALMVSVANVKIGNYTFPGCIGVVYYGEKEYRLATYLGVKIKKFSRKELWIEQGKLELQVKILEKFENSLLAPVKGKMTRTVYESVEGKIQYRFWINGIKIFDFIGKGCFESGRS